MGIRLNRISCTMHNKPLQQLIRIDTKTTRRRTKCSIDEYSSFLGLYSKISYQ
jgi:hypothetical protein